MKLIRTSIILLILALLLSSVPTTGLSPTQAAKPQMGNVPPVQTIEPLHALNNVDPTEPSSLSVFSGPSAPSAVHPPLAGNWHIECADCPKQFTDMTDRSLRLDGDGHPHIAYGEDHLYYAWHDGTGWRVETVDSEALVGAFTSLALDGSDRPHISYFDNTNLNLKYAWYDGTGWRIETVDSEGGWYNSLALDGAGRPHISYYHDGTNDDLKYAWHDGTDWQVETVNSEGWEGAYTSLALDGSARPHISYLDWVNDDLKYAWRDGTGWHIEIVDSAEEVGRYTSLALDGSDRPHISYFDDTNRDLKYAWHDGTGWQIETVDGEGWAGYYTSLALDGSDRPRISYGAGDLKYAWHNGIDWQIETVDNAGFVGLYISLTLDRAGWPHISYHDATNGDLKHVRLIPPFLDKQATPSDGLRNNDTLTYTLTISSPGSNVRLWDPLPTSVHYVSGSITGTVTPPAVYSPTVRAVVWQGMLPTDTVQVVRFQVTPGITGTGSLSLSLPIVNTAWLTDMHSGASTSATVIVNGWRVYLSLILR